MEEVCVFACADDNGRVAVVEVYGREGVWEKGKEKRTRRQSVKKREGEEATCSPLFMHAHDDWPKAAEQAV